ncbi:MAG: MoaD/ThiS family protein [Candidatus Hadarchaeum sp.]
MISMSIRVKVELMPGLRPVRKENVFEMELPPESNLKSMLLEVGFREDEIEHLRVFVNEKLASLNKELKDGDNIWIGIVMGGGDDHQDLQ